MTNARPRAHRLAHGDDARRRVRPVTFGGLLVVAMLTVGACGPDGDTPTPATQEATTVADPEAVLKVQAAQLRTLIDEAAAWYPATRTPVISDNEDACQVPSEGRWPRQWSYGRRLFIAAADSRALTRQAVERFTASGWSARQDPSNEAELRFTLQKDGFIVSVAGGAEGGTWQLIGSSPCVNEDGTAQRRAIG